MKLAVTVALVIALGGAEIERAQQVARSREAERAVFHHRYLFDLPGDTVTQIEVITEFRRLVMITEDHIRIGDQMFSRGARAAEAALAPTRGLLTLKAQVRFNPLNTYVSSPAFRLALGQAAAGAPLLPVITQITSQYSPPYKARNGQFLTALTGAVLQADLPASSVGQTTRPVGVVLDGTELVRVPVDFARLD